MIRNKRHVEDMSAKELPIPALLCLHIRKEEQELVLEKQSGQCVLHPSMQLPAVPAVLTDPTIYLLTGVWHCGVKSSGVPQMGSLFQTMQGPWHLEESVSTHIECIPSTVDGNECKSSSREIQSWLPQEPAAPHKGEQCRCVDA